MHEKANFDHALYCQPHGGDWKESPKQAGSFMRVDQAKGLIQENQHCYNRELHGRLTNRDTLLKAA